MALVDGDNLGAPQEPPGLSPTEVTVSNSSLPPKEEVNLLTQMEQGSPLQK